MSNTTGEWVTRKEGATLARCSEDAIRATVKKFNLVTQTNAGGALQIRVADLVRVGRIRPEDLAGAPSAAECVELARARQQVASANIVMPLAPDGQNVVLTHSGWGDGVYPVLKTFDADGRLLEVHIDLLVVH